MERYVPHIHIRCVFGGLSSTAGIALSPSPVLTMHPLYSKRPTSVLTSGAAVQIGLFGLLCLERASLHREQRSRRISTEDPIGCPASVNWSSAAIMDSQMATENDRPHFCRAFLDTVFDVLHNPDRNSAVPCPIKIGHLIYFAFPDDCSTCQRLQNFWKRMERDMYWDFTQVVVDAGNMLARLQPEIHKTSIAGLSLLQGDRKLAAAAHVFFRDTTPQTHYLNRLCTLAIDGDSTWLGARAVRPDIVDYGLVREWVEHCRQNHSTSGTSASSIQNPCG